MRIRGLRQSPARERRDRADCRILPGFRSEPEDIEAGFVEVRSFIHLFMPNPCTPPASSTTDSEKGLAMRSPLREP
jgi:hypothetical protein